MQACLLLRGRARRIYGQSGRVEAKRAPFGCEMMSCTSSGLFSMTSAASLKVTPSRLMLLREIRRPPADEGHSGIPLASQTSPGAMTSDGLSELWDHPKVL